MESTPYSIPMHLVNIKSITETTVDNLYHPHTRRAQLDELRFGWPLPQTHV